MLGLDEPVETALALALWFSHVLTVQHNLNWISRGVLPLDPRKNTHGDSMRTPSLLNVLYSQQRSTIHEQKFAGMFFVSNHLNQTMRDFTVPIVVRHGCHGQVWHPMVQSSSYSSTSHKTNLPNKKSSKSGLDFLCG